MEAVFKTAIKCCVVGAASISPLVLEDEHTIVLALLKTLGMMAKGETTVIHSLGEIRYNVSNASVYLAAIRRSDLK